MKQAGKMCNTVRGKILKWEKLTNLANRMPFTIFLSANYFFLWSVVAIHAANILPHQNFPMYSIPESSTTKLCAILYLHTHHQGIHRCVYVFHLLYGIFCSILLVLWSDSCFVETLPNFGWPLHCCSNQLDICFVKGAHTGICIINIIYTLSNIVL